MKVEKIVFSADGYGRQPARRSRLSSLPVPCRCRRTASSSRRLPLPPSRPSSTMDRLLPTGGGAARRACSRPCAIPAWAAASACGPSSCWPAPRLFKVGAHARPAHRQRHRVRARLFADPRRPAGDGRRRPAPRQALLSQAVRRGDGDPGRRRAAGAGLRGAGARGRRTAIRRSARRWSSELARAAGAHGMVGGQMLDLLAETQGADMSIGAITRLQRLKTGALISFSCTAGAILGKASEPMRAALSAYAHDLGLAFQIVDDLLDVEGTAAGARQDAGQGRRRPARPPSCRSWAWSAPAPRPITAGATGGRSIWNRSARPADLLRQAAKFVVARRA